MNNIAVSVIIPVYNAGTFLEESIESVQQQILKEIEIICIDDGSTDNSLDILNSFAERDNRIKVIQQQNLFAGIARNNGLKIANGEYIYFFDCDDILYKDSLKKMYSIAKQYNLDIVIGKAHSFDHVSKESIDIPKYRLSQIQRNVFDKVIDFSTNSLDLLNCPVPVWTKLFKYDFLETENIKFPPYKCVNDLSFFIESQLKAKKVMLCDINIQNHRRNNSSSLLGNRLNNFHYEFDTYDYIYNKYKNIPCGEQKQILGMILNDILAWLPKDNKCIQYNDLIKEANSFFERIDYSCWNGSINCKQYNTFKHRYTELLQKGEIKLAYSLSYRIRRRITFVPRKIRGLFRCLKENGFKYTVKYGIKKIDRRFFNSALSKTIKKIKTPQKDLTDE